jgi:two-component system, LuxR family, sensor kinase FixL
MAGKSRVTLKPRQRGAGRLAILRSRLANIVESSSDAIFSRELDGTINTWNRSAELMFGYRPEEIVGMSSSLLLPPDRPDETVRLLNRVRRGERVEHFETKRVRKDGGLLTVSLSVSPIWDEEGRVVGASTIARDITVQREMEDRILENSEQEMQALGRELHDGLGQQLGGVDLLGRTLARTLRQQKRPEARTAQMLVRLVRQAWSQTRALARGLTPAMESPDALMLALDSLSSNTSTLLGVRCVFQCEEPVLVHTHSSSLHLFRIAQAAIANAIRHGRAHRVDIVLASYKGELLLEIRDNGKGLARGWQKSPGLGLRIMRYRAAALEGTIQWAKAKPHGVVVTCRVPLPGKVGGVAQ